VAALPPCRRNCWHGPARDRGLRTAAGGGDHDPAFGWLLSEWLRAIIRWRVPVRFYGYALGLPVLIMAVMNVVLAALGQEPEISLVVGRIPAYAQTLLITAVIFGGQEEPGWRGFAQPRLEERHAPQ
jgi:membrane protease YdiL (CAAX protease family)